MNKTKKPCGHYACRCPESKEYTLNSLDTTHTIRALEYLMASEGDDFETQCDENQVDYATNTLDFTHEQFYQYYHDSMSNHVFYHARLAYLALYEQGFFD